MERKLKRIVGTMIERYEVHDMDGHPDFSIWLPGRSEPLLAECKNVRDSEEAYRTGGQIVAYKAYRGHEPILICWARFGRFPAWQDWLDWLFLGCHITNP